VNIISVDVALVRQGFLAEEVRPLAGLYLPEFIRLVTERYGFGIQPTVESAQKSGAIFEQGRLVSGSKRINIKGLSVFSDGIWASTHNTSDSEYVVDDALHWAKMTFGMRDPQHIVPRMYDSHIVVEFDQSIDRAVAVFEQMKALYQTALMQTYGRDFSVQVSRLGIGFDPLSSPLAPQVVRTDFGIERRENRPFSDNRFYCVAPLRNEVHLELLRTFELLATSRPA
jgi:hypothetical protein